MSDQTPLINIPVSKKILYFSLTSFTFTLFLIDRQRRSLYIRHLASDRAVAGRALLLGTAASCSGVGVIVGAIATAVGVESFKEFANKTDSFFLKHGIKRPLED